MAIVRTYCDKGRSGLRLQGRIALQQLIEDIQRGHPGFDAVLVLDVSRRGRFQNADEAAFYEYLCIRHGVRLVYVAEPFESDDTPLSAVLDWPRGQLAVEAAPACSRRPEFPLNRDRAGVVQASGSTSCCASKPACGESVEKSRAQR